jgi:heme a synthase
MTPTDKRNVRIWYWSGAALVFLILVIGGITRLTGSGLSMVDWRPIMGAIPPITETQWEEVFDQYKEFPEYRQVNRGMSLSEFKFIFFWEYIHRMAGRLLGLVFIVPFAWFVVKKKIDVRQLRRASVLFALGAGQALMGWYMVQSGLIEVPQVSPYRLAAHLILAFVIFGLCVWFALDLRERRRGRAVKGRDELKSWLWTFMAVLVLQVLWGAFVAGHHAGHIYNTFPKMNQFWMPPELWMMEPWIVNFFHNMSTVQWMHRLLATVMGVMAIIIWVRTLQIRPGRTATIWMLAIFALVLLQYAVGVFTLVYHVPVWLGVTHQALAMILFGVVLGSIHHFKSR